DINGPISTSADNDAPPAGPSTLPQPPSISPPKFPHPPNETDTYLNSRPTLSLAVDRYIIISSLVCFFALLVYLLPSSPDFFTFYK
ncbi:hypothetical protein HOY80DRAFT_894002, partial [Tuber brumale]